MRPRERRDLGAIRLGLLPSDATMRLRPPQRSGQAHVRS